MLIDDQLITPNGEELQREYLRHPGAVAVLALDDQDRVAVVHQYRHPLSMRLVEPPAGLLDVDGEAPLAAAQRELAEEAGLKADRWNVLVDFANSPGISDEVARIYLARGLTAIARPAGFALTGEEIDMGLDWLPLADGLAAIRQGLVNNVALVLGLTALGLAMMDGGLDQLRPGDSPWPAHEQARQLRLGLGDD